MSSTSLDPRAVDWARVQSSSFLIHQRMSYEYPSPIDDLQHQLVVFPPRHHGDQRRVTYRLEVSGAHSQEAVRRDAFGNLVVDLSVPHVENRIDFQAWAVVQRRADRGPHRLHRAWLGDRRFLDPSPLTLPDSRLRSVAAGLSQSPGGGEDLTQRINAWVHTNMTYVPGVTDVHTTAARALHLGQGVCQDSAHLMIALCRLNGLPARYVSGHLVGEAAMHAWVEVLLPCGEHPGEGVALAFDPTHGRRASLDYLTVAVGRDFTDVSPTKGTFRAAACGSLSSGQSVTVTDLRYKEDQ